MSRVKNISRSGWFVVGMIAALLLVPTAAAAVTSSVIIKGGTSAGQAGVTAAHQLQTNSELQGTSGNQADVTPAGQLQVAQTAPSTFIQSTPVRLSGFGVFPLGSPPAGTALVMTELHVDTIGTPTAELQIEVNTSPSCSGNLVGSFTQFLDASSGGETDIPLDPGVAIPSGDSLCAVVHNTGFTGDVYFSAYTVPSAAVSATPIKVGPLSKPRR
jgi:hypothetical protein